jgi:hypothetical protein
VGGSVGRECREGGGSVGGGGGSVGGGGGGGRVGGWVYHPAGVLLA